MSWGPWSIDKLHLVSLDYFSPPQILMNVRVIMAVVTAAIFAATQTGPTNVPVGQVIH